jgi:hypothetical protein
VVPPSYVNGIQAGGNLYLCSGNPTKVPYTVSESVASAGFDWCIPTVQPAAVPLLSKTALSTTIRA